METSAVRGVGGFLIATAIRTGPAAPYLERGREGKEEEIIVIHDCRVSELGRARIFWGTSL